MILRFIIAAALLYLLYRLARRFFLPPGKKVKPLSQAQQNVARAEDLVEDSYCHAYVPVGQACTLQQDGKMHYFCSPRCREMYEKEKTKTSEEA